MVFSIQIASFKADCSVVFSRLLQCCSSKIREQQTPIGQCGCYCFKGSSGVCLCVIKIAASKGHAFCVVCFYFCVCVAGTCFVCLACMCLFVVCFYCFNPNIVAMGFLHIVGTLLRFNV